jgi:hypothetical protein
MKIRASHPPNFGSAANPQHWWHARGSEHRFDVGRHPLGLLA